MKKVIYFLFGKPYIESTFLRFFYWFAVGFYLLNMMFGIVSSIIFGGWLSLLILAIAFPFLFRFVYTINVGIQKALKGANSRMIFTIGAILAIVTIGIVVTSFFFGKNVAINTSKTVMNGKVCIC